jgi:hypothetical protein
MNNDVIKQVKAIEEHVEICANCGAENPPGLLLCLACGHNPTTGRDLFAPPDIPIPAGPPEPLMAFSSSELAITLPEPIQVPDPLPIPTQEDFVAPSHQPYPKPTLVYRAPPPLPKDMAPLLRPLARWSIGLLGLAVLTLLGLGTIGSLVTLNLPGSICLGSLWLATVVVWLGIVSAHRGDSRSQTTGARRRLIKTLGQRLFEITPGPAKEQRVQQPATQGSPFTYVGSELIYWGSTGDRTQQLTQLLLGTLCALVAGDNLELATQTYEVLTASPFKSSVERVKRMVVSRHVLYVGAGYLENLIFEQLRRSPSVSVRDLTSNVLRQAGTDLLDRIAAEINDTSSSQQDEAPDLEAQVAALREYCDQLKSLNPDLYEQLTQEVEEAVRDFTRAAMQRSKYNQMRRS